MQVVIDHFNATDPVVAKVVAAAFKGERPIVLSEPIAPELYFSKLANAVVNQQLSTKAAATIWRRFDALLEGNVTPERVVALDIEQMRGSGVSRQKAGYLQAMAEAISAGRSTSQASPIWMTRPLSPS